MTSLCIQCGKPMQAAEAIAHAVCPGGSAIEPWLRAMAVRGGKGVVDGVDARSLGRAADEIAALRTQLAEAAKVAETNIAEQCAEIAERHGYDDAAFAIRSAFPAKES